MNNLYKFNQQYKHLKITIANNLNKLMYKHMVMINHKYKQIQLLQYLQVYLVSYYSLYSKINIHLTYHKMTLLTL